jgi:hypothetical protein
MKSTGRVAGMIAALLVIGVLGPGLLRLMSPQPQGVADFYQEWSSARSYWLGEPLYQETRNLVARDFGPHRKVRNWLLGRNVHPPTAVLLGVPFGRISYRSAFFWWNVFGLGCLIAAIVLIVGGQRPVAWTRLIALSALLLLSPHLASQFVYGQLSLILLLLLSGAGLAWAADRRGLAGTLVGLAAAVKVFPAVLGWLFLVRRDARGLIGVVAGFGVASALTWSLLGTNAYVDYFRDVVPEAWEWRGAATNSSMAGVWSKLFDPGPRGGHVVPLRPDPLLARGLTALSAVAILTAWGCIIARSRDQWDRQMAFAVGCVAMLLLSPIAWEHYVILLLPAIVVFWDATRGDLGRRLAVLTAIVLLNVPLHRWVSRALPELQTEQGADAIRMLGVPSLTLYGLLALFSLGVWLALATGANRLRDKSLVGIEPVADGIRPNPAEIVAA